MVFVRLLPLVLSGLLLVAGSARAQMYVADLASAEWKVAAAPFSCSLSHNIPVFGKAVLARKAGGSESFYIESDGKVAFPPGLTGIETLPPVWRNDLLPLGLGVIVAGGGDRPINLNAATITAVVAQLSTGMKVMFTSQPVTSVNSSAGLHLMRVVLEAKNFAPAYKTYQQCIADLIPYNFDQVARTFINYGEKADGLTPSSKASIARVARYANADAKVLGIFVDGHSDNTGTAEVNETNAKQEAEWVSAYLVEKGVTANKITTRWHSDKFPIADNKSPAGRAQNRRVTVRLENEASRKESEKKAAELKAAEDKKAVAEKKVAPETSTNNNSKTSAVESSSVPKGKMTPEQINRMVEGLDLQHVK